jgi:hypothetical protein
LRGHTTVPSYRVIAPIDYQATISPPEFVVATAD